MPRARGGAIRHRRTSRTRNPTRAMFCKPLTPDFLTDICANYEWTCRKHAALEPAIRTLLGRVLRQLHGHETFRTSDMSRSTTTTTAHDPGRDWFVFLRAGREGAGAPARSYTSDLQRSRHDLPHTPPTNCAPHDMNRALSKAASGRGCTVERDHSSSRRTRDRGAAAPIRCTQQQTVTHAHAAPGSRTSSLMKSANFWYTDGNIVIKAESKYYKLHSSRLVRY